MDDSKIFGSSKPNQQPVVNPGQPAGISQQQDNSGEAPVDSNTVTSPPPGMGQQAPSAEESVVITPPATENEAPINNTLEAPVENAKTMPSNETLPESQQQSPSLFPAAPSPSLQNPVPENNGQGETVDGNDKNSFFSPKSIFKILLGLGVLIVIAFLVVKFILPMINKPKNEEITLNYWGLWEDSNLMQSAIADFEKENPNIKIKYSKQDIKQYRERLATRIENNSGPDIFRFHNTWYPMLSKYLTPIPTDVIKPDEFKKTYYNVVQEDLIKNGAIYGIPLEIDTLALYVNEDLFKYAGITKYPTTWEEFATISARLTVKDGEGNIKTAGAAMGTFENIAHAPDIISMLFLQNGVSLSDVNSTSQETADALKFYTSFAKGEGSVWNDTLDNSILAFSKGNLGMCFGYSWDAFNIKALSPNLNYKVIKAPQLALGEVSLASYWVEGVSVKSKHQEEALLFLKFLSKKETSQKLFTEMSKARMYGEPYARIDLADSLKTNMLIYPFVEQAKNAQSSYMVDATYDNGLNDKSSNYLKIAVGSIIKGTSAESATETLIKGLDQVLQQYGK